MRILVADDDVTTRLIVRNILEREGFEVSLAVDGVEALESFRQNPADIVITDFQMPRMDGIQLCRELTAARGSRFLPIIMLTGGQESALLRDSLQAGALEFLNKPVLVDEDQGGVAVLPEITYVFTNDGIIRIQNPRPRQVVLPGKITQHFRRTTAAESFAGGGWAPLR